MAKVRPNNLLQPVRSQSPQHRRTVLQPKSRFPPSQVCGGTGFSFPLVGILIPRTDAVLAVKLVLNELGITPHQSILDFQTESITHRTFCKALERLTGSDLGLRTAGQIYERQQARERIWADH
jgi:hypothetical protein